MLITRAGSIEVSQYFLSFLTDYDSSSKKANTNRNVIREKNICGWTFRLILFLYPLNIVCV